MSLQKLAEDIKRLLPEEDFKRIRQAILLAAQGGAQVARQIRTDIDRENRLKDGLLNAGSVTFTSDTSATLDLFAWVINYEVFQPGSTTLPVQAPEPVFSRVDYFHGYYEVIDGANIGKIYYTPGVLDSSGNNIFPNIPNNHIILAIVNRNADGSTDPIEVPPTSPGIPDAPFTGKLYGRRNGEWYEIVISGSGGIEEAPENGQLHARKNKGWVAFTPFSGNYNDLSNKPTLFSGNYNDLSNRPTLFSGSWNDLSDRPSLFSGNYNDLSNKPTLFNPAGTPAEGDVVKWISGVATWGAGGGGGGGDLWSELSGGHIFRNSKVIIGQTTNPTATTLFVKGIGQTVSDGVRFETFSGATVFRYREDLPQLLIPVSLKVGPGGNYDGSQNIALRSYGFGNGAGNNFMTYANNGTLTFQIRDDGLARFTNKIFIGMPITGSQSALNVRSLSTAYQVSIIEMQDTLGAEVFQFKNNKVLVIGGTMGTNGNGGPGIALLPNDTISNPRADVYSGGFIWVNNAGELMYQGKNQTITKIADA